MVTKSSSSESVTLRHWPSRCISALIDPLPRCASVPLLAYGRRYTSCLSWRVPVRNRQDRDIFTAHRAVQQAGTLCWLLHSLLTNCPLVFLRALWLGYCQKCMDSMVLYLPSTTNKLDLFSSSPRHNNMLFEGVTGPFLATDIPHPNTAVSCYR